MGDIVVGFAGPVVGVLSAIAILAGGIVLLAAGTFTGSLWSLFLPNFLHETGTRSPVPSPSSSSCSWSSTWSDGFCSSSP